MDTRFDAVGVLQHCAPQKGYPLKSSASCRTLEFECLNELKNA